MKLFKVRKLINSSKENTFISVKNSGFVYTKEIVNEVDKKGNTALYYTAKFCNSEFCKFLFNCGADPN